MLARRLRTTTSAQHRANASWLWGSLFAVDSQ